MLVDICSDNNNTSCIVRLAVTNLILTRNHIEIDPASVNALNHTLGTKDIVRLYEAFQDFFNL